MIWFIAGPLIAAVLIGLWWLGHSPYGYVRLSEFPALFCCLLAGPTYRADVHRIMVTRKRRGDADPREAMSALAAEARMEREVWGETCEPTVPKRFSEGELLEMAHRALRRAEIAATLALTNHDPDIKGEQQ